MSLVLPEFKIHLLLWIQSLIIGVKAMAFPLTAYFDKPFMMYIIYITGG
jgi:hypothetical protein